MLLEFAIGIGIFLLSDRFRPLGAIPGAAGLALAALGVALLPAMLLLTIYNPDDYQGIVRVLCWGLPSGAILLGLIIAERRGLAVRSRTVLLLGAASYAIYLLHPIVLGQLLQLPPAEPPLTWLYCLCALLITIGLSVTFHLFIEAPLLRSLRALLSDPPPVEQRISTAVVLELREGTGG